MKNVKMFLIAVVVAALAGSVYATPVVMDDGDAGFAAFGGNWFLDRSPVDGAWNNDYGRTAYQNRYAEYAFTGLDSGTYEVYATWVSGYNKSIQAEYGITGFGAVDINQRIEPIADLTLNDGTGGVNGGLVNFQKLFSNVEVTDGTLTVILAKRDISSDDRHMIAEAVALDLVPEPMTMSLLGLGALALIRKRR